MFTHLRNETISVETTRKYALRFNSSIVSPIVFFFSCSNFQWNLCLQFMINQKILSGNLTDSSLRKTEAFFLEFPPKSRKRFLAITCTYFRHQNRIFSQRFLSSLNQKTKFLYLFHAYFF
eukprot:TRINITY_DN1321_c0_g1_i1.p1 TRINITY_DN1321_c0_g1~~TRINITY_DN1321_c0_g1_i1.p1  ORF type:complete len:120 (-),score=2.20 TRINITY_DN1321_c0_g1_i1:251-610(-)